MKSENSHAMNSENSYSIKSLFEHWQLGYTPNRNSTEGLTFLPF